MRFFIVNVLLILFSSCVKESQMVEGFLSIQNGTQFETAIEFYSKSELQPLDNIVLNPNEKLITNVEESENLALFTTPNGLASGFLKSDSLHIIFANERLLKVYLTSPPMIFSAPVDRNLYRIGNYESIGNDEYLFTITQEDYNNATPCDGPCE